MRQYKIRTSDHYNTGGNCTVGISSVLVEGHNVPLTVYINEEGGSITTVDYIRSEEDFDDYDAVTVNYFDYDKPEACGEYLELYKECIMNFFKVDCLYFNYHATLPYELLTDKLKQEIDDDYLQWIKDNRDGRVAIYGEHVVIDYYY